MNKWRSSTLAFLFALVLSLAACTPERAEPSVEPSQTEEGAHIDETTYPFTTEDATGTEVVVPAEPKRIVSLMPSNTEILFALDLNDRIIGVSDFDTYPAEALEKEKIGGMEFNVESIIALQPDLVLAHELNSGAADGLQQLREANIPVYVVKNAAHFDDTYDTISMIGELVNRTAEADRTLHEMQQKVDELHALTKEVDVPTRVFVETSDAPTIFTPGSATFVDELLSIIHAENVITEEGWVQVSPEAIVEADPEVIIVMYDYVPNIVELIPQRPAFSNIQAVRDGRIIQVDEDVLSRPGPRLVEGLEQLANAIYPELFAHD